MRPLYLSIRKQQSRGIVSVNIQRNISEPDCSREARRSRGMAKTAQDLRTAGLSLVREDGPERGRQFGRHAERISGRFKIDPQV